MLWVLKLLKVKMPSWAMCSVLYRGTKRSFTQYQSEGLVPALRYKVVLLLRTMPWWYGHHRTVKRTHSFNNIKANSRFLNFIFRLLARIKKTFFIVVNNKKIKFNKSNLNRESPALKNSDYFSNQAGSNF